MHKKTGNFVTTEGIPMPVTYYTAATVTGSAVDMAKYHNYAAIVHIRGATQWQDAITAHVYEGTNSTQFSTVAIATATYASATTHSVNEIDVRDEEMTPGYRYLRTTLTMAGGTGNMAGAINCRFNPRYGPGS